MSGRQIAFRPRSDLLAVSAACSTTIRNAISRDCRRTGFTLIEVLIVVVILAILAATILPQFSSSAQDAQESALRHDLYSLRSQIDLYKVHHAGATPTLTANSLPQLVASTNQAGTTGTAGPSFPYGPYLINALPVNPFTGSNTVTATSTWPPTAASGANGGWLYYAATGQIAADSANYLTW